jgi:hypothetical protein
VNDWTLLIDFGTSFTRAAIADADGRIEPIELDGDFATPSGIWVDSSGTLVAGLAAQQQARLHPERWDRAPGRSLGQSAPLHLGGNPVDPAAAVAEVLRRLAAEAIRRRRSRPVQVRLTCSARWGSSRREALLAAARLAGLGSPPLSGPPELVEYPVAAALRLARLDRFGVGAKIALIGLGGGSTEIAVLEYTADGILIRALGGIEGIGGEQFDELLYRQLVANALHRADPQLARNVWQPPDGRWRRAAEELFREVRRAKEELSRQRNVHLDPGQLIDTPLQLSRIELEAVLRPLILRSARELATTIELAGLRARQLDGVLLTGGSSRIPLVTRAIFDVTGVQPQHLDEPDLYLGAATWTPKTRVGPETTPLTVAGGQTGAEAAAAAAEAAAALAATGALDLSWLVPPREPEHPPGPEPAPARAAPWIWRRRWPVIAAVAGVAVILLIVGLAVNGSASDDGGSEPPPQGPVATPEGTPTPDPMAVTGLEATTRVISIDLAWDEVPGAAGYKVYRDAGTDDETVRTVPGSTFTDRPGDGDEHRYSVAAVDDADQEGPRTTEVGAVAETPYGDVQDIASAWTAVVPVTPGKKGSAGQTCKGSAADAEESNGRISCTFGNGVRLVILRYASKEDRDQRSAQLADRKRVVKGTWQVRQRGGTRFAGRLLTADSKATAGPWRFWTYNATPTYALYAAWPKHSAKQLTGWWKQKAPFRT